MLAKPYQAVHAFLENLLKSYRLKQPSGQIRTMVGAGLVERFGLKVMVSS